MCLGGECYSNIHFHELQAERLNTYLCNSSKKLNDLTESENEIQEVGQQNRITVFRKSTLNTTERKMLMKEEMPRL